MGGPEASTKCRIVKISTPWQKFRRHPIRFLARRAYAARTALRILDAISCTDALSESAIRVVCISDTHGGHHLVPSLPQGDILIHAGDLTRSGTEAEVHDALRWLRAAPHLHKVFIAGNHDTVLAIPARRDSILAAYPDLIYLEDSSARLTVRDRQLAVFGSPRTVRRGQGVFQYPRGEGAWAIPPDTDIVVTHGPPKSYLDVNEAGCVQLREALWGVRPLLHVFGHIHGARGVRHAGWSLFQRAYERICDGPKSTWRVLPQVILPEVGWRFGGGGRSLLSTVTKGDTILVNASSKDPMHDGVYHGAIVVDLMSLDGDLVSMVRTSSGALGSTM